MFFCLVVVVKTLLYTTTSKGLFCWLCFVVWVCFGVRFRSESCHKQQPAFVLGLFGSEGLLSVDEERKRFISTCKSFSFCFLWLIPCFLGLSLVDDQTYAMQKKKAKHFPAAKTKRLQDSPQNQHRPTKRNSLTKKRL